MMANLHSKRGDTEAKRDLPILAFESEEAWEERLDENSATSKGLWHKIGKKPDTRARRIEEYLAMLSEHEKL
jgi:uncharacterized protein YdeI (YjbR/CyaY-like superfamily)